MYTNLTFCFSFWGTSSPRTPTGALPLEPTGRRTPHDVTPSIVCKILGTPGKPSDPLQPGASKGTPGDTKCVTQILRRQKIRKLSGEFTFLFQGKIIKSIKPPICYKTYLQTSLIPQFFHDDTPWPSLKGGGTEHGGRMGKEEGEVASWLS